LDLPQSLPTLIRKEILKRRIYPKKFSKRKQSRLRIRKNKRKKNKKEITMNPRPSKNNKNLKQL
jgi:hypothetical protein